MYVARIITNLFDMRRTSHRTSAVQIVKVPHFCDGPHVSIRQVHIPFHFENSMQVVQLITRIRKVPVSP